MHVKPAPRRPPLLSSGRCASILASPLRRSRRSGSIGASAGSALLVALLVALLWRQFDHIVHASEA
jgi:hypothetical protein